MIETVFYTRREAADTFRVSRSTMDSWINQGVVKATRIGRRVLISASEIYRLSHPS